MIDDVQTGNVDYSMILVYDIAAGVGSRTPTKGLL